MLNLFKPDFGRAAVTLEEIKDWAYAQEDEQLRSRVDQRAALPLRGKEQQ